MGSHLGVLMSGRSLSDWEVYPTLCPPAQKLVRYANRLPEEDQKEIVKEALEIDAEHREWHKDNVLPNNVPLMGRVRGVAG